MLVVIVIVPVVHGAPTVKMDLLARFMHMGGERGVGVRTCTGISREREGGEKKIGQNLMSEPCLGSEEIEKEISFQILWSFALSGEASPNVFISFLGWWLSCNSVSLAIVVRVLCPRSDGWSQ